MEGQGRIYDDVVGEELVGVVCCMGSGLIVLKFSAIQHLVRKIKPPKKLRFFFLTL